MRPGRKHAALSLVLASASAASCKSKLESVPPAIELLDSSGAPLSSLAFPGTAFGSSSTQTFTIVSLSSTPLSVSALQIGGSAQAFYSVAPADGGSPLPLSLEDNQSAAIAVTFSPVATPPVPQGLIPENATLTVTSNDPVHGQEVVPLDGLAAAPSVSVCWISSPSPGGVCLGQGPLAIQFGDVPLGRGNTSQPALIEVGAVDGGVPVTITSVSIDGAGLDAGYQLVSPIPSVPAVLPGGHNLVYYVALFPRAVGPANGNLIIESDDPHFPPGSPPQVQLLSTVTPRSPPVACEGVADDTPLAGAAITTDGGLLGNGWVPAPLDTVVLTGIVDAGCSSDPVDPQSSLLVSFSFVDGGLPPGSAATLQPVAGNLAEKQVQLDLAGRYQIADVVTDRVGL
ncbi:MAG TPA: hypothetical protein VMB50_13320, partial [Myxococcales bacterium]|nr:hypothetical protein [Myxococcales bacterium]